MILIKPSYRVLFIQPDLLQTLERAGRTCYKSEEKITEDSAERFVDKIINSGHLSVIEHANIIVRFICDRGVSHELVRHRLASFSQESTRYCNYRGGVTFIIPPWIKLKSGIYKGDWIRSEDMSTNLWTISMLMAENTYIDLLELGESPQQARSVLPNALKTEIVMTANVREWRHVFKLRTSKAAHPQMRELMIPLLDELRERIPIIFNNIGEK